MQSFIARKLCSMLVLIYLTSVISPNDAEATFTYTAFNKALVGFAFKTTENVDWLHCIQDCQQEVSCISYNFWRGKCELNNCGFEHRCSAENTLMWASGSIFQQLAPIENIKSRCEYEREKLEKNETVMINGSFSCTQEMSIYVDGKTVTFINSSKPIKDVDCYEFRPLPIKFAIPQASEVIAIAVVGNKGATIIGSFTDGVVTDVTWKCTSHETRGWELPNFNDQHWKQAEKIWPFEDGGGTDNLITGISPNAEWIEVNESENKMSNMYCRLRRKMMQNACQCST